MKRAKQIIIVGVILLVVGSVLLFSNLLHIYGLANTLDCSSGSHASSCTSSVDKELNTARLRLNVARGLMYGGLGIMILGGVLAIKADNDSKSKSKQRP